MTNDQSYRPLLHAAVGVSLGWSALALGGVAHANHGSALSAGTYRIPYADGTSVAVGNDAHNHNDAYDMSAGVDAEIVAAAGGWIRAIRDHHGQEPNAGDGLDAQNPAQAQDDALEHACGNNDPGNTVATSCADHNNYVWIEHPNGEYTKYSHLGTGTVSANWTEGDWIDAGEVIGLENDIGAASSTNGMPGDRAYHLHFEVAAPNTPGTALVWSELGGFIQNGTRRPARICDITDNDLAAGNSYTANPCNHQPPVADAGGPYVVDEGSSILLDGTGSTDPEGNALIYAWLPEAWLDDPALAQPTYLAEDDDIVNVVLTVYDQIEALRSTDLTTLTVQNVPPTVAATGDIILEGQAAIVYASFSDPGPLDTHTATIDWGDGTPTEAVAPGLLAAGIEHTYGDDGTYAVTVTVEDDDGGVGQDSVDVQVDNLTPELTLDTSAAIAFPGGDYVVAEPDEVLNWNAEGVDAGSDDLTFEWGTGQSSIYFNDGIGPDPLPSPHGTFPFVAADGAMVSYGAPGFATLSLLLTDDDDGSDSAMAGIVITGTATGTEGDGFWKHQFSGHGASHVDAGVLAGYLEAVGAVSSVFPEDTPLLTDEDAHAVLHPTSDKRDQARAALLVAWLHFVSGGIAWDATVPLQGGGEVSFLDLMFDAEAIIMDPGAAQGALLELRRDLDSARHAY